MQFKPIFTQTQMYKMLRVLNASIPYSQYLIHFSLSQLTPKLFIVCNKETFDSYRISFLEVFNTFQFNEVSDPFLVYSLLPLAPPAAEHFPPSPHHTSFPFPFPFFLLLFHFSILSTSLFPFPISCHVVTDRLVARARPAHAWGNTSRDIIFVFLEIFHQ